MIKSRRLRWAGHVASMGRSEYTILVGKSEGRRSRGRSRRRWKDNIKMIFYKWVGGHGLDRSGSVRGQVASSCECGNEPSGSTKCGEFLEQMRTY